VTRVHRIVIPTAAAALMVLAGAGPVSAVMTKNDTGCAASANITDTTGNIISTPDQDAVEIKMPRTGNVDWRASVAKAATKYHGAFSLDLGVKKVSPPSWKFKGGPQRDLFNNGVTKMPRSLKYVPPGKYKAAGFRTGDGLTCEGYATLVIEGSPFKSPTGIAIMAVTLLSFIGLLRAGRAKS